VFDSSVEVVHLATGVLFLPYLKTQPAFAQQLGAKLTTELCYLTLCVFIKYSSIFACGRRRSQKIEFKSVLYFFLSLLSCKSVNS